MNQLEGSTVVPDTPRAILNVILKNTTKKEVQRIFAILHTLFDQGVFNMRRGSVSLNFNEDGKINSIHIEATKWHGGRPNPTRVAMYEKAIVMVGQDDI